jgi:hypothetical protein
LYNCANFIREEFMSLTIDQDKLKRLAGQSWDKEALALAGVNRGQGEDNKLLCEVLEYFFSSEHGESRPKNSFRMLHNCILNSKAGNLKELAELGASNFRNVPNAGAKTLKDARELLRFYGLQFWDDNTPGSPVAIPNWMRPEIAGLVPAVMSLESCRLLIAAGVTTIVQLKELSEADYLELCRPVLVAEFQRAQRL